MEDEELLAEFREEATEALDEAELALLALDRGEDFSNQYKAIFRAFHSIKGAAGMFGLEELQKHFHHLESLLEKAKNQSSLDPKQADYFLKGVDVSKDLLDGKSVKFPLIDPMENNGAEVTLAASQKQKTTASTEQEVTPKKEGVGLAYLVDDEEDLVDLLKDTVEEAGFEVKVFLRAKDLIEEFDKKKPDVILSDIKMPEMSGTEMIEILQQKDPDIPVVFLSGHLDKNLCIECLSFGAFALVEKPIEDESTLKTILINAAQRTRSMKLLNKSIKFIMYQFSDLDKMLQEQGKDSLRESMKTELDEILKLKQDLKTIGKTIRGKK